MSNGDALPAATTREVRDACLCLHVQRAARALSRRFDEAFRALDLTSGQFSLLMSLNRETAPRIGEVSALLAMDRTTLTANLKPLERRGLVRIGVDPEDKRGRRLTLTPAGRKLLAKALPLWRRAHAEIEALIGGGGAEVLRADLRALCGSEPSAIPGRQPAAATIGRQLRRRRRAS